MNSRKMLSKYECNALEEILHSDPWMAPKGNMHHTEKGLKNLCHLDISECDKITAIVLQS